MPCIFCLAVFAALAGTVGAAVLDRMQEALEDKASGPVERVTDTESVARFAADFEVKGRDIPVAVTVYKDHKRVRIQVLTHDITRDEAEKLENRIASALDLKIVSRSDAHSEAKVREAFERSGVAAPAGPLTGPDRAAPQRRPDRAGGQ